MKYNEFIAFSNQLEKEGSSVNEFFKSTTGKTIFEAEEELDTSGDTVSKLTNPRFAIARKKLTNNAKDFRKKAKVSIIDKFMPNSLTSLKSITNKIAALAKNGKNPEEINKLLAAEAKKVQDTQNKSITALETAIDKLGQSYQKRVDQIINNEKIKDKLQVKLSIYWTLLETQVKQILFKEIIKNRDKFLKEAIGDNPELEEYINLVAGTKNYNAMIAKLEKEVQDETNKYKNPPAKEEAKDTNKEEAKDTNKEEAKDTNKKTKSFESYKTDVENEFKKEKGILLAKDIRDDKNLSNEQKKELLKIINKNAGVTDNDLVSKSLVSPDGNPAKL